MPIDYKNGKIYTIRCRTDDTLIYVGSTCETLSTRIARHRYRSKTKECENILLYQTVNNNWDNWYIELYEDYPCERKEELLKREGEIIRAISTLNKIIAGRTKEEYYEEHKDIINNYKKQWYEQNKEVIAEKGKQYREEKKEIIAEKNKQYYEANKEKLHEYNKEWREQNKEVIAEKRKEKYEKNKEAISEKLKEKTVCTCGCEIRKSDLNRHMKSKKHLDLIQSVN